MEPEERAALLRKNRASMCRDRLSDFVRHAWTALEPATQLDWSWHHDAICDHVQWAMEEWARKREDPSYEMLVQNLLINIPPRSLKSKIVSVCAPAWAWLRWSWMTFIALSANPRVAVDNARESRDLIESHWYQTWFEPTWVLKSDRDAVSDFGIEEPDGAGGFRQLGWRKSRGWFSKITGEGADCLLPDDPHDAEEVNSTVERNRVLARWDNAIWNRVRDLRSSIRIGIMQRLHESDFSGHVLAKMEADPETPRWCLLKIPLEYSSDKPCATAMPVDASGRYSQADDSTWKDPRTADGEIMDPVRFPPAIVASERKRGSYSFAGQYNQNPAPAEGGMFQRKHWRFFRLDNTAAPRPRPPGCSDEPSILIADFDQQIITVDAAFKKLDEGSRVSIQVLGTKGARRFVLADRTRTRDFKETVADIAQARLDFPRATRVLIEDKANGTAVINTLKGHVSGVIAIEPQGGKESRAAAIQPEVEAGDVYLLDGAGWLDEYVTEFSRFPRGKHDDRVDALSQALADLAGSPEVGRFLAAWA